MVLEKINSNFLNDDFFNSLLAIKRADEEKGLTENNSQTIFNKFLEFANECYIHGITVGMKVAIELYEDENL